MTHIAPLPRVTPEAQIGERLIDQSASLVGEWLGSWRSALPDQTLVAQLPVMIRGIGHYVQNPQFEVRQAMLTQLRTNGWEWRRLDCDAHDLLAQLDGLSKFIVQRMQQEVAQVDDARLAMPAFMRIFEGLRGMTSVVLDMHLGAAKSNEPHELLQHQPDSSMEFAHELRGRLQTISLSTVLLEMQSSGAAAEPTRRQVRIIRDALVQAEWLLQHEGLLTGSGHAESLQLTASVARVLESVTQGLDAQAAASGVELRLPESVPRLAVEAGVAHLILSNLLGNAIKYSDPTKDERWVTVRAEETAGDHSEYLILEVADNGIGIPADMQEHVFRRGCRVHPQAATGLGLGLAIIRRLLDDRGGGVDLVSEERVGTTVRCRLPASPLSPN
jgi:signal transduction histidine kinase